MSSDSQAQQRVVPPSRRRDKPILSCSLCRRRKLKCDRQQPCKACVGRGLSLSCTYTRFTPKPSATADSSASTNVYDRIDQLEKLVTTLMEANRNGSPNSSLALPPTTPSGSTRITDEPTHVDIPIAPDKVELHNDETRYANSGHWTSVLDGIAELKAQLDDIPIAAQDHSRIEGDDEPELLFGGRCNATREEILVGLPSKTEGDQLVESFFARVEITSLIIHRPTFLREYEKFWEQPEETPIMWIGLLWALFTVSTYFNTIVTEYHAGVTVPSEMKGSTARVDFYRQRVVQCLHLANYPKCPPHTLEAMLLYFMIQYLRSRDVQFEQWLSVGIIVRTAFRMGYHRDPSRFPNISPFNAEMRRRLWILVVQIDLMTSVAVGLPIMIQPSLPDVREPRNIDEQDLYEEMTELPPERPESETSLMLYCVARNRLLRVLAKIQDHANASEQHGYREALELDADLRTTYAAVPESMKCYQARNFDVASDIAMRRLFLGITYLKSLIMIHRPFMLLGREDSRYEYSRMMCLDAAIEILDFQNLLEFESRTNFNRWSSNWKIWTSSWRLSSLVNHDFLLATSVLLLDLNKDIIKPMPFPDPKAQRIRLEKGQPSRSEVVGALIKANFIWELASEKSREAAKVSTAINLVLGKVNGAGAPAGATPLQGALSVSTTQQTSTITPAANATTEPYFDFNDPGSLSSFPLNEMNMMDFGENFDWAGLNSQYPLPSFEQNMQNSYF
ncbi:hypothetical protein DM02DRAFT_562708 [Periconia macrospinosa]|uniref:Zn(2)-C6 fungal-type domain-containing protein n=1 Tax=Periconia macrospinosa TaxID=97972 RepID=A0A2V1DQT2_9PLEO|nr:hypothetical protein DM02DRAFT_562708 [Periconia macrospinosa]